MSCGCFGNFFDRLFGRSSSEQKRPINTTRTLSYKNASFLVEEAKKNQGNNSHIPNSTDPDKMQEFHDKAVQFFNKNNYISTNESASYSLHKPPSVKNQNSKIEWSGLIYQNDNNNHANQETQTNKLHSITKEGLCEIEIPFSKNTSNPFYNKQVNSTPNNDKIFDIKYNHMNHSIIKTGSEYYQKIINDQVFQCIIFGVGAGLCFRKYSDYILTISCMETLFEHDSGYHAILGSEFDKKKKSDLLELQNGYEDLLESKYNNEIAYYQNIFFVFGFLLGTLKAYDKINDGVLTKELNKLKKVLQEKGSDLNKYINNTTQKFLRKTIKDFEFLKQKISAIADYHKSFKKNYNKRFKEISEKFNKLRGC